jgi:catecholate siderophore receptor
MQSTKGSWPVAYRWLALGAVAVYTAVGCATIGVASAQELPRASRKGETPEQTLAQRFDIAPSLLESVLRQFEEAAKWHIDVPDIGMLQLSSPGVAGAFRPDRALDRLLRNTGLSFRIVGDRTATLEVTQLSGSVDVSATISGLAESTPKYSEPLLDTPQTVDVVPQSVMEEQNVTTLRDALRNVAGISLAAGEGGSQGDNLTIRGFSARNDLFIDGMRDFGSYYRDPFDVQEVEVLQGPSSVNFGRGSTGGVVNQATKTAGLTKFISGDFDLGTDLTRRVTLDVNTPLNQTIAFRLNVMGNEGNVAGRDIAENRRFGVAPSLAFGLGTPTRVTLNYLHQTGDDIPDYGIPWLFNGPAPVDRRNYYGFKDGNFLRTCDDIATIKAEHDFSGHLTLRSQTRYANYARHAQITEPQLLIAPTLATPLSSIMINRNEISVDSGENNFDQQLDLIANFETGHIRHTFVSGLEAERENSDPIRPKYTNVPATSLLDPDENQVFTGTATPSSNVHTRANSLGAYFLDTMKFGKKWDLSGGLRRDRFNTHYTQSVAPATAFNRLDDMPTWRTALVFKPVPGGSIYVMAGTSFNPSAESLSLSAANANLPPEKNKTFEGGTKWDFANRKFTLNAAVFRTTKTNAREPDPNNPLLNVLAGDQRVNGLQFAAAGHITRRWEMRGSYAFLDGRVVSSQYYPAAVGARLANVPRETFTFWNNFRLPKHWETGGGGNFVASRTASSTVPLDPVTGLVREVPGYWVFNAMVSHPLNEHVTLQANVYNIAHRYYYDELHPAHIVLGPGRSALIGFKFKF